MEPQAIQDIIALCVPQRMAHVPGIVPRRAIQLGMHMVAAWFEGKRRQLVDSNGLRDPFDRVQHETASQRHTRHAQREHEHDGDEDEDEDDDDGMYRFPPGDSWSLSDWLAKYPLTRSRTTEPLPMFSTDWLVYECLASDLFEGIRYVKLTTGASMNKAPESILVTTVLNGAEMAFEQILKHRPRISTHWLTPSIAARVAARGDTSMVFVLHDKYPHLFENSAEALTAAAEAGHLPTVRHLCTIKKTVLSAQAVERASVNRHLQVVQYLHELTRRLPGKMQVDQRDAARTANGTAHEVVELGATNALSQVLANGDDHMAAYLVRIGATVSNDAFVCAAAGGCISAIDAMLRQDTSASLDIGSALQNTSSRHPMVLLRLQQEWRSRHGNESYPLAPAATMKDVDRPKGDNVVIVQAAKSSTAEIECPSLPLDEAPLSVAFEVFTNRELVRNISHFRPLSAKMWYERVMRELPSSIRDFVDGAQIPGLLPRLAIMLGEVDVLVPLHSMSQNPAYRRRRDLDFSSAMYDAAIEGRVDVLELLHEMPGMPCRCDTMAVAVRSGWTDVVDWLAKHRPESAESLTSVDIAFAAHCGFEEIVRLVVDVHKLKLIQDSPAVEWTAKSTADTASAASAKTSWWQTFQRKWKG